MCAVIGFAADKPTDVHLHHLINLFTESQVRGLHAFGFSYILEGRVKTFRSNNLEDIIRSLKTVWPVSELIGHCRYSTSGDWQQPENNQPLVKREQALVFNGVISMKTKIEMEREFGIDMSSDNDGEIALHYYNLNVDQCMRWIKEGKFSFAGIFLNSAIMVAIRNKSRPMATMTKDGALFIGSTVDIFARAGMGVAESMMVNRALIVRC